MNCPRANNLAARREYLSAIMKTGFVDELGGTIESKEEMKDLRLNGESVEKCLECRLMCVEN